MTDQDLADFKEALDQEKCTKQFALNARKNAKFLSSLQKESQFIAKNVMLKKVQEDFNILD
jgi:hypothetical protein